MLTNQGKNKTLILHIGFPKTATTFFQKDFFPNLQTFEYFGKRYRSRIEEDDANKVGKLIGTNWKSFFQSSKCINHSRILSNISNWAKDDQSSKTGLFSSETIIESSMRWQSWKQPQMTCNDPCQTAVNLKAFVDQLPGLSIRILITIRRQDELLAAWYATCFDRDFSKINHLSKFDDFINFVLGPGYYSFIGAALDYKYVLDIFEKTFGAKNVFILVYEDLIFNPERFFNKLEMSFGDCHIGNFDTFESCIKKKNKLSIFNH